MYAYAMLMGYRLVELDCYNGKGKNNNAIYGMMFKKGNGLKSISIYDSDCLKILEIHNEDHHGTGPHYHYWKNGEPIGNPIPISSNPQLQQLLNETISYL